MLSPHYSCPEALEARIAPASLVLTSATDGGKTITITTSKGTLADLTSTVSGEALAGTHFIGDHPEFSIDFTGHSVFRGTNLTVTTSGGAAFALQELDATGFNLGAVSITGGETGMIVAGAGTSTPALRSLQLDSLGYGSALHSQIKGPVGTVHLTGDLNGTLELTGPFGALGSAAFDGKLAGGATAESGSLITSRGIGSLAVTGDLAGGAGERSGGVYAGSSVGSVSLHSMLGGLGLSSGSLSISGNARTVLLNGSLTGDTDPASAASNARISAGAIGVLTIHGAVSGGAADSSGSVTTKVGIGKVTVDGAVQGGAGLESGSIGSTGAILSAVAGSLAGGSGQHSGSLLASFLGQVVINGSVTGGSGPNSGNIASSSGLRSVVVHGSLNGGTGEESGAIGSKGPFQSATIDGDVTGNTGPHSGRVVSTSSLGTVLVTGQLLGGDGPESGAIGALGNLGSVTIHGQIVGSTGANSGSVLVGGTLTSVVVDGNVTGGIGRESGSISAAGRIVSATLHGNLDGQAGGHDAAQLHSATALGTISIDGSVIGGPAYRAGSVYAYGPIASVTVGKSLSGIASNSDSPYSGAVFTDRPAIGYNEGGTILAPLNPLGYRIGQAQIGEALLGGEGFASGSLVSYTSMGKVVIGASHEEARAVAHASALAVVNPSLQTGLFGGFGQGSSGSVLAGSDIDSVVITGGITGGKTRNSGSIESSAGRVTSVFITGDATGGAGLNSGSILAAAIGSVRINGNVTGLGQDSGSIIATGADIGSVTIGGTLSHSGSDNGPTRIAAQRNLGSVTAFATNGGFDGAITISAGGNGSARTAAEAVAIGSVRTVATLSFTDILTGYAGEGGDVSGKVDGLNPVHGHVSVGTVEAGTGGQTDAPWEAVNVLAGVTNAGSGSVDLAGGNTRLPSVIANVIIHGTFGGSSSAGSFYVTADEIRAATVSNMAVALHPGLHNDSGTLDAENFTTFYYEVGTSTGNP